MSDPRDDPTDGATPALQGRGCRTRPRPRTVRRMEHAVQCGSRSADTAEAEFLACVTYRQPEHRSA